MNETQDLRYWTITKACKETNISRQEGTVKLDKLTPVDIQRAYAAMRRADIRPPTIDYCRRVLTMALNQAVEHRRLTWNPAHVVETERPRPPEKQVLSREQLLQLFTDTEGTRWHALWVVLGTTGMRVSEALALRWDAIDWDKGTTHLTEQLEHRTPGSTPIPGWFLVALKSASSARDIHFPPEALAALEAHRTLQKRDQAKAKEWKDLGLIFATPNGRPIALNTVYGAFKRDILRQSLVDLSPHSLRHTIITLWLDAGVPVHHVAAWAGHANPTVTMRVYAHVLKRKQEEMADTTERALWGEKQKEDAV